ncbi:MAG: hypothetical protein A2V70_13575 [Planctomycetes bacterium RBG_13_63_9]|nr:MAG: hypothetical protein A2V70_13575 [Planctomycetes bacterium RBG_13_63_9]
MENLEPRQLLTTSLGISGFRGDGDDFVVRYEVGGEDSPAFDVDIYRSADGEAADALLMSHRISDPAELSVGTHSVTIEPDFVEVPEDYFLVVELDGNSEVVETDETDNQRRFEGGIFQTADGTVHVHGDGGQDQYGFLDLDGSRLEIWYDSESPRQFASFDAYTGVHVRTHGGDDTISMMSLPTADTPFWAFGGDGADLIGQAAGGELSEGSLPLGPSDQDIIYNGPSDGSVALRARGDLFDLLGHGSQGGRWRAD